MTEDAEFVVAPGGLRIPRFDRARWEQAKERYAADVAPVVADLRAAGLDVDDLGELVNSNRDYRAQLPVLVAWLSRCDNRRVREMIVRALTIPAARKTNAPRALLTEFADAAEDSYRWAVGNALGTIATPREIATVMAYFRTRRYGTARQELARAIARLRPPEALEVLTAGLADDEIAGHCAEALGVLGDPAAVPALRLVTTSQNEYLARTARAAIRRIEGRRA
jgi:hypothetical protein